MKMDLSKLKTDVIDLSKFVGRVFLNGLKQILYISVGVSVAAAIIGIFYLISMAPAWIAIALCILGLVFGLGLLGMIFDEIE